MADSIPNQSGRERRTGSQVEVIKNLKYSTATSDEHLYWPYEGEFWRDELGTYTYTFTKGCKDRLNRPRGASSP